MKRIVAVIWLFCNLSLVAQETKKLRLELVVMDSLNNKPLSEVVVVEDSLKLLVKTNHKGIATLRLSINGNYQLHFYKQSYEYSSKEIRLGELPLVLDTIFMRSNPIEYGLASVLNESSESFFDGVDDSQSSYLSIGRDVFDRKAAFDWGSSFFNRRGLKSSSRTVLINGLEFNRLFNGSVLWGQWGGLNDFFRNQEQTQPLEATAFEPSKGLGITSIDLNPFLMRKGNRISSSISDKSYRGRLMLSIINEPTKSFRYGLGGSIRVGSRGYKKGTPYQAYSYTAHIAKQWNQQQLTSLHYFRTYRENAKSSALSKEVVNLLGRDYNPNWGFMGTAIRSAKTNTHYYKTLLLTHQLNTPRTDLKWSIMAQSGSDKRNRLYYDTAESPNPIYYKKLPSYYINSFLGANFYASQSAKYSLLNQPQLNWNEFYTANEQHPDRVHYALIGDIEVNKRWATVLDIQKQLAANFKLAVSLASKSEYYSNYARAEDLMGGTYLLDRNPFDKTINDIDGPLLKEEKDTIQYAYNTRARQFKSQAFLNYQSNRWKLSLGFELEDLDYDRDREFINQRFENTPKIVNQNFKGTQRSLNIRYAFDARNYLEAYWSNHKRPVSIDEFFINARENNRTLSSTSNYKYSMMKELSYVMRWRRFQGRISAYSYRFDLISTHRPYYVHSSFGSVFVQEILSDNSTSHKGIEGSFNFKISPVVDLEGAFSIGDYSYINNPHLQLELTQEVGLEGIEIENNRLDLGSSNLKDYRLGAGPSKAFSLSISYRDPNYWFSSLSFNRIEENYIGVSPIRFTNSFLLNKEHLTAVELLPDELELIKTQEQLQGYYITNLVFGKSYLKNGRYTSIFLSIDNLLGTDFKSGGYESSRFGNYEDFLRDQRSTTPLFPTKYWWSSSRRFFLNLTIALP